MNSPDLMTIVLWIGIAGAGGVLALLVRDLWMRGRTAEARFREFANAMPHVVFTTDAAGSIDFMNAEFATVTGQPTSAALGEGIMELVHPDDREQLATLRRTAIPAGNPVSAEYRLLTTEGYRWRLMRLVPVRDGEGKVAAFYGTATDIDDVRRDSARLRDQAAIFDQLNEGIVIRDLEHRVLYWSGGAERMYGWTSQEVKGRPVTQFLYVANPEAVKAMSTVLVTGEWEGRLAAFGKDGSRHVVEVHWTLARDEAGAPKSVIAIHLDITDRLALEERLQQALRLESVGELSGGLAHDFNNILTVILGNSELLVSRLGADPRMRALAEMTRDAAQRGAALTQHMLAFARRQVLDPTPVDVGELLRGMREVIVSAVREDVALTLHTADGLWHAEIDRSQLENAIISLCANARDAMPNGGTVRIAASNVDLSATGAARARELAPGNYVRIDVADTGVGIAPEVLGRVFEPFFTTKPRSKGTGLGLSMVYGFAKQSAGHASIISQQGKGTTVTLLLPKARVAAPELPAHRAPDPDAHGETILVTEDDELVRTYVCEQLVTFGYKVEAARDARAAMRILEEGTHVDLLFTDVVMPGGMNGRELAGAARALRPGLAVLFTSGYPEDAVGPDGRFEAGMHLLGKPYNRALLAQKIRAALASRGPSDVGAK